MTHTRLLPAAALALCGASPALADVTAQDVWTNWQELSAAMGQEITAGTETMSGDTLTLTDVMIVQDVDDGRIEGTIDEIAFTELGDGTVSISMSPSYEMVGTEKDDGETLETTLSVEQSNLAILASGDPDSIDYAISADAISMTITPAENSDDPDDATVDMALTDLTGSYATTTGDLTELDIAMTAAGFAMAIEGTDIDTGDAFSVSMEAADLDIVSASDLTEFSDDDMAADLAAGFATDTSVSYGEMSFAIDVTGEEAVTVDLSAASGAVDFLLAQDGMGLDVLTTGIALVASGAEIPLPQVAANMEEIGFGFSMPVIETDDPQPFDVVINLGGLTVSEMIWGIFDPEGQIPRDPATLLVDLSGQMRLLGDIFADVEMTDDEVPAELSALDVTAAELSVAGAELTANGAFTFDNSDLETFDGLPAPDGQLDLQLVGGNALLQTLVALGFVPQDQAMAASMMVGLFARPGPGEDTLVSTIRVEPDGSIFANDQQIQ